jgi:CrcB protein
MSRFLWVCLGGAVGTGARHLLSGWALERFGTRLPYGTLAVNVLGSFLAGLLMQHFMARPQVSPTLRFALTAGVLGGFTTYSAFNNETVRFLQDGSWSVAGLHVVLTVVLCLAAGLAGVAAGRALLGA